MKVGMAETSAHSAPPPTTGPPGGAAARHEHMIELEASKSWKRKRTVDYLKLSPLGLEIHHGGVLLTPLTMPLGAIALACTESGPSRPMAGEGRFPVLRRISSNAVVPREEGVEGWLWTASRRLGVPAAVRRGPGAQRRDPVRPSARRGHHQPPLRAGVRAGARRPLGARQPGRLRPADARPRPARRRSAPSPSSASPSRSPTARSARRCGARCPRTSRRIRWSRLRQLPRVALRGAARPRRSRATVRGPWSLSPQHPTTAAVPAAARVRSSPTSAARRAR